MATVIDIIADLAVIALGLTAVHWYLTGGWR